MALQQFLSAIRGARARFFGRMNEAAYSGRRADTASLLEAVTETADAWLTPELIKDYSEADFKALPADERTELDRAICEFRQLTEGLQGRTPTADQIRQGYEIFAKINNIQAPHFGTEPEFRKISEATRSVHPPPYVLWTSFHIGTDSTGDPAVWIWLVVRDDVEIESPAVQAELASLREELREAIQRAGIDRWPYITVCHRLEIQGLIGGVA